MRPFFTLAFILVAFACNEKSEVTPMFPEEDQDVVFSIKVPLSKDIVGNYDASEIFEDESLDMRNPGIARGFWNGIKYNFYDLVFKKLGYDKIKYSFDFEFPEIDRGTVKSVHVKKVFFAIENCRDSDRNCILRKKSEPVTFDFLDKLYMSVIPVKNGEPLSHDSPTIDEKEFLQAEHFAYHSKRHSLLRFYNSESHRKSPAVAEALSKTLILRLREDLDKESKLWMIRHLRDESYRGILKDFTVIGHNVYLELTDNGARKEFFKALEREAGSVENLGIDSFEQCSPRNCADIPVGHTNLVSLLEKSNNIRFDTYISVDRVQVQDFRYNGYVELEFTIRL